MLWAKHNNRTVLIFPIRSGPSKNYCPGEANTKFHSKPELIIFLNRLGLQTFLALSMNILLWLLLSNILNGTKGGREFIECLDVISAVLRTESKPDVWTMMCLVTPNDFTQFDSCITVKGYGNRQPNWTNEVVLLCESVYICLVSLFVHLHLMIKWKTI
jgi:hypothetical protein